MAHGAITPREVWSKRRNVALPVTALAPALRNA